MERAPTSLSLELEGEARARKQGRVGGSGQGQDHKVTATARGGGNGDQRDCLSQTHQNITDTSQQNLSVTDTVSLPQIQLIYSQMVFLPQCNVV